MLTAGLSAPAFGGSSKKRRLVIVGDSEIQRHINHACAGGDWEVLTVDEPAGYPPSNGSPDLVVVDICPGGRPRLDRVSAAKMVGPRSGVIAVTRYPSLSLAVSAVKAGAINCVAAPFHARELEAITEGAWAPTPVTLPSLARIEWDYM
jgi:DNA-binding NtrC family response regulator